MSNSSCLLACGRPSGSSMQQTTTAEKKTNRPAGRPTTATARSARPNGPPATAALTAAPAPPCRFERVGFFLDSLHSLSVSRPPGLLRRSGAHTCATERCRQSQRASQRTVEDSGVEVSEGSVLLQVRCSVCGVQHLLPNAQIYSGHIRPSMSAPSVLDCCAGHAPHKQMTPHWKISGIAPPLPLQP